jgi:hypothetical protein
MVYALIDLIASTVLDIVQAAVYFSAKDTASGAGNIVGSVINICN